MAGDATAQLKVPDELESSDLTVVKFQLNLLLWSFFRLADSELDPVPPSPLLIQTAKEQTRSGAQPPAPPPPDCSRVRCPSGSICEMVQEPCRFTPCSGPIPECKPIVLSAPATSTTASPPMISTASPTTRPPTTVQRTLSSTSPKQPLESRSASSPRAPSRPQPERAPSSSSSQSPAFTEVGPSPPPVAPTRKELPAESSPIQRPKAFAGRSLPAANPPRSQQRKVSATSASSAPNTAKVRSTPPSSTSVQQRQSFTRARSGTAATRQSSSSAQTSRVQASAPHTSPSSPRSPSKSSAATCSGVMCPAGGTCRVVNGVPQCGLTTTKQSSPHARASPVPTSRNGPSPRPPSKSTTATCSGVVCPAGSTCQILDGIPQCGLTDPFTVRRAPSNDPCLNVRCQTGTACRVVNVGFKVQAQCLAKAPVQFQCPANESWRNCSAPCEPTCERQNPTLTSKECSQGCGAPRCQCNSGFFRHRSGFCKLRSQC